MVSGAGTRLELEGLYLGKRTVVARTTGFLCFFSPLVTSATLRRSTTSSEFLCLSGLLGTGQVAVKSQQSRPVGVLSLAPRDQAEGEGVDGILGFRQDTNGETMLATGLAK